MCTCRRRWWPSCWPAPSQAKRGRHARLAARGGGHLGVELADALDVPAERIDAGWAYLEVRPPSGLRVQRHAEHFRLVTDNSCTASVERYLSAPTALSRSASRSATRWPSWRMRSR